MGTVDLAVRSVGGFQRLFAIKRPRRELEDRPDLRAMFIQEAEVAGRIHSAHTVPVVDVGDDESGPYMVMEYVGGMPVSALLAHARAKGEALPVELCLAIARQAAVGLHVAHELTDTDGESLNLVHRDVSPDNLLLGFDGVVRLTDFGVARVLGSLRRTDPGVLKGKVSYMSPEQLRFDDIDRRSDLYALGVVLFELLAGARPYGRGDVRETIRMVLDGDPPDIVEHRDDVHPMVVELLFRLMNHNVDVRPANAKDVAEALADLLTELGHPDGIAVCEAFVRREFRGAKEEHEARIRSYERAARDAQRRSGASPVSAPPSGQPKRRVDSKRRAGIALVLLAVLAAAAILIASQDSTSPYTPPVHQAAPQPSLASPQPVTIPAPVTAPAAVVAPAGPPENVVAPSMRRRGPSTRPERHNARPEAASPGASPASRELLDWMDQ